MVLATPTPPTSRDIPPNPSSSPLRVWSAACCASRASEGRDTFTSLGLSGLALRPTSERASATRSGSRRT
ncbi:hypothetical protein [Nocardiopsis synnemataformans]|uniref:hypothetical protein n=1 Tax=Nocardiopsis synnemataformans TaxID=61305 RepID=UPI003EC04071